MTLGWYKFRPGEPEVRIICEHLGLVGLLPGRAVVFEKHQPTWNRGYSRGLLSELLAPVFFSVLKVTADSVVFGNGNPAQDLAVPIKAVMGNGLGGHFYDAAEWWQWQAGLYEEKNYQSRREKSRAEQDKELLAKILSSNKRIVTDEEAKKLGIT